MFPWSASPSQRPGDLSKTLRRIESKLDRILEHLNLKYDDLDNDPGLSATVKELAEQGQKIAAIKTYREQTGAGLKEAKDAVESYLAR